jgi:hypothetical protein
MPKYVVNFGSIKVGEGKYVNEGEEIELNESDPMVTEKHPVMDVDKEGQPYQVGKQFVTKVSPVKAPEPQPKLNLGSQRGADNK